MPRYPRCSSISESFTQLSSSIHLYTPPKLPVTPASSTTSLGTGPPSFILLFAWTAASPNHIAKYASAYLSLYPSFTILVVTTSISSLLLYSTSIKHPTFEPTIRTLIKGHHLTPQSHVLLHAFSEGGSSTAVLFATAYRSLTRTRLPLTALILDSTPCSIRYTSIPGVVRAAIPHSKFAQAVGSLGGYAVTAGYIGTSALAGDAHWEESKSLFAETRHMMNNERLWPVAGTKRCYLFGSVDRLADELALRAHAAEAQSRGAHVRVERFEGARHCALVRDSADAAKRYWSAVSDTWQASSEKFSAARSRGHAENGLEVVAVAKMKGLHLGVDVHVIELLSSAGEDDSKSLLQPDSNSERTATPPPTPSYAHLPSLTLDPDLDTKRATFTLESMLQKLAS